MGYTHYWNVPKPIPASVWSGIVADVTKLVEESPVALDAEVTPEYVDINGVGDDAHENLFIDCGPTSFGFCKTARNDYDLIVCAALIAIKDRVGAGIEVTSDGRDRETGEVDDEWDNALAYAMKTLGRNLKLPFRVIA